jgi:outer membrane protein assembly factor BamB
VQRTQKRVVALCDRAACELHQPRLEAVSPPGVARTARPIAVVDGETKARNIEPSRFLPPFIAFPREVAGSGRSRAILLRTGSSVKEDHSIEARSPLSALPGWTGHDRPMRRAALIVAAALVVVAAAAGGYVLYVKHSGRDISGSSTVEYNPTAVPPPPVAAPKKAHRAGIVWPTFGYDNQRLRNAPMKLRPPFRVKWIAGGGSLLEFPPAIAYGRLFVANGAGTLLALDARTGRRAWSYRTGRCVAASPAVSRFAGGTVYQTFLNKHPCNASGITNGEVVALAAGTGRVRWRRMIGPSESSPLVAGSRVYVGDWLGNIYALDASTGRTVWVFHAGGKVKGAIAMSGGKLYVGAYDGHVYALDADTGKLLWRASGDPRLFGTGTFYSTPSVAYDRVFIGSTDDKVYSFGASSGLRRWSHSTGGYVYASPAVAGQRVFVGSYDHDFYAFDAATGAEIWSFHANGPISGSATVLDGLVYFSTLSGRTYALAAATGRRVWSFPAGEYSPVVADSRDLYLLGAGKIYALRPSG